MENYFFPNSNRAKQLSAAMRTSLLESLEYLIDIVKEYISAENYQKAKSQIIALQQQPKLSGYLHALNYRLLQAIEKEDEAAVKDTVALINGYKPISEEINIVNFSSSELAGKKYQFANVAFADDLHDTHLPECTRQQFADAKKAIHQSLNIIEQIDKDYYDEIKYFVSEIFVFNLPYNVPFPFSSATSFVYYGTIIFNAELKYPSIVCHIDKLVHETTHLYLLALPERDELVLNPKGKHYKSPLRKDLRSMAGVYHATFVLARILYVFNKLKEHSSLLDAQALEVINQLIPEYVEKFYSGIQTIREQGQLSELGATMLEQAETYVKDTS